MLLKGTSLSLAASCLADLLLPALDQPLSPRLSEHNFEYSMLRHHICLRTDVMATLLEHLPPH